MIRFPTWLSLVATGCVPHLYGDEPVQGEGLACGEAPENAWADFHGEPPADLVGQGFRRGEVLPDFCLADQNGQQVGLWPFYGNLVLLDISTIWCGPCQELGRHTEATWQRFKDEGFVYLTVLQENQTGGDPGPSDLQLWVETFGITAPVLDDGGKLLLEAIQQGQYPAVLLIDRDMRVLERVDGTDVDTPIEQAI